jgi:hypothetical protein
MADCGIFVLLDLRGRAQFEFFDSAFRHSPSAISSAVSKASRLTFLSWNLGLTPPGKNIRINEGCHDDGVLRGLPDEKLRNIRFWRKTPPADVPIR